MSGIRPLAMALGTGVVLLTASCGAVESVTGGGSTPSPTPSANGVADKSAAEIVRLARRAFQDATSVQVKGNGSDDGVLYAVDVRIKGGKSGNGGKGKVTISHNSLELLRIGEAAYVKGEADFWTDVVGDPAAGELLKGKYLKASSSDPRLEGILVFTDAELFAKTVLEADGTLTKGERRTIRGAEAIGVDRKSGEESTTLYVATTGQPYPLQLQSTASAADHAILDFVYFDSPPNLTPPPADLVVDTSKLGN